MRFCSLLLTLCLGFSLAQSLNVIPRDVVQGYKNNPHKIRQNIIVQEGSKGFLVQFIKPDSFFAAWGLAQGDLLISANGVALGSFRVARVLYAHIMSQKTFQLTLKRNGQTRILTYEIR